MKSQSATNVATIEVQPNAFAFLLIKHLRIAVVALGKVNVGLNAPVLLRKRASVCKRNGDESNAVPEAKFIVHAQMLDISVLLNFSSTYIAGKLFLFEFG